MKKATILCLLLAVLSAAFLAGASAALDQRKGDVTAEETVLSGDPSAAEGLRVTVRYDLETCDNIFWDITHRFGAEPEIEAEFRFVSSLSDEQEDYPAPVFGTLHHPRAEGTEALALLTDIVLDYKTDRMFAYGHSDGEWALLVLRESTRERLGLIPLAHGAPVLGGVRYGDGFAIVVHKDGWFSVIAENEDGGYGLAFADTLSETGGGIDLLDNDVGLDYCDGRLAIADRYNHVTNDDYYVAVYTADGLQFEGGYWTSLRRGSGWVFYYRWVEDRYAPIVTAEWEA